MRQTINLGDTVRDTISGFSGVVVARTEWLNGCVRITVAPKMLHENKVIESCTFDVEQITLVETATPQVQVPTGGDRPAVTRSADPR